MGDMEIHLQQLLTKTLPEQRKVIAGSTCKKENVPQEMIARFFTQMEATTREGGLGARHQGGEKAKEKEKEKAKEKAKAKAKAKEKERKENLMAKEKGKVRDICSQAKPRVGKQVFPLVDSSSKDFAQHRKVHVTFGIHRSVEMMLIAPTRTVASCIPRQSQQLQLLNPNAKNLLS
jgi:hypothetical protein